MELIGRAWRDWVGFICLRGLSEMDEGLICRVVVIKAPTPLMVQINGSELSSIHPAPAQRGRLEEAPPASFSLLSARAVRAAASP